MSDVWAFGTHVGKYELLQKLAIGGMAEIFLARARGIEGFAKHVVVKRILPQYAEQPQFVRMFLDEARLAARLDHPHIAAVYDIGQLAGDNYFFTMEFVHGEDVRHVIGASVKTKEWLPLEVGVGIATAVASGLHYAHDLRGPDGRPLGIVHRDVSLSNILVSYDGAVKVLDFGIAKAASHTSTTLDGTLKGKLAYMSPEQCRGETLDRRSDVFALGIVLYQMTAMAHPFGAKRGGDNDLALLNRIIHQEPPRPSIRRTEIPMDLERIILKALAKDPGERYPTALALLEELETFALEHRLNISTARLRRFMHQHFGERIEAWRQAEGRGVSLADHVARERAGSNPESGMVSAQDLLKLREPQAAARIPSSDEIVPPGSEAPLSEEDQDTEVNLSLRPKLKRWHIAVAAAAGLLSVIAWAFWPSGHGAAPPAATTEAAEEAVTPAPSHPPVQAAPLTVAVAGAKGPDLSPVTKADEVTILLQLDPADATIQLDGIATSGQVLHLPKSDHVYTMVVSAPGYKKVERELRAVVSGEMSIKLKKKKAKKASSDDGVGPMETDL